MTPTNELTLSKLKTKEEELLEIFHPSELKYLFNLVMDDVNKSYGVFG